jgi:hypothetical protein
MIPRPASTPEPGHRPLLAVGLRSLLAVLLGVGAAVLISCGGAGKGLIPAASAGPLRIDFETVEQTAESGDGDCTATEAALVRTEEDFNALPNSVDSELSNRLRQGISNLRKQSLELCRQPLTKTATTPTTTTTTTPTETTSTPTETTSTPTETEPETEEPSGPAGGTPAPGEGEEASPGVGENGGAGGAGAQEVVK